MGKSLLTLAGYKMVEGELVDIKTNQIPRVNKRVADAMNYGNSELIEDAMLEQSFYEARIMVLTKLLEEAEIVS